MNISLIFETGRIAAKLSKCAMYCTSPEVSAGAGIPLQKLISGYIESIYSLRELYRYVEKLEKWALSEISFHTPKLLAPYVELEAIPFCFLLNRIISSLKPDFAPEMQFYIIDRKYKSAVSKSLSKIRRIEQQAIKRRSADRIPKINEVEGKMLGYPGCCVSAFTKLKQERIMGKQSPSPERVIAEEFVEIGLDKLTVKALKRPVELPEETYSLFTTNFYPCSLKCDRAIELGKTYQDFLDKIAKGVFTAGVAANLASILVVCIDMKITREKLEENLIEEYKANPSAFHGKIMQMVYRKWNANS